MISDELFCAIVPVIVYWAYSGIYVILENYLKNYRLHTKIEEDSKNIVSKSTVVKGVLVQQMFQIITALILFKIIKSDVENISNRRRHHHLLLLPIQFFLAMAIVDTWQYFMHRYMHVNHFLYKHIHSKHHALVIPYAFGALYNHPLEGLLLDTLGGAVAFLASGMPPRAAVFFFSFGTIKTVDDHCGVWLPSINILQLVFGNNAAYHDIHHQLYGSKYNFSQPFFVMWDRIFGTYMGYQIHRREEGGFEARPIKD